MASIQNEYSLLCRHFEPDLSEIALHENIGLLAWSPLARGKLSGKYLDGARPPGTRLIIDPRKDHRDHSNTDDAIRRYIDLAHAHNLDPCQMALAFVNSRPFLASTLIGATNMDQLRSNIDSIDLELSQPVLDGIAAIRRDLPAPF
jgi:aryl-alcohol dehydrogenase-like predicted oxidoreductase